MTKRLNVVHLDETETIPTVQSAYRRHHSTQTALTIVVSDILITADGGYVSAIALIRIAASDTIDHLILL